MLANYEGVHEDWEGNCFCRITLKWDYIQCTCKRSIPGYIEAILNRFYQPHPIKPELAPHRYASRSFSATNVQDPVPDDNTAHLNTSGVLRVQRVVGCIRYYARETNSPLLPTLTEIGTDQAKATKENLSATKKNLDSVATLPDAE